MPEGGDGRESGVTMPPEGGVDAEACSCPRWRWTQSGVAIPGGDGRERGVLMPEGGVDAEYEGGNSEKTVCQRRDEEGSHVRAETSCAGPCVDGDAERASLKPW
jgi:hypothetical protein